MLRYITQRVLSAVLVLVGVSMVVFTLIQLSGDPASALLPVDTPEEEVVRFRKQMGFDQPLPFQYAAFLSRAVVGDFGYSYRQRAEALPLVLERLPATIRLTLAAILFSLVIAIPLGILAALRNGGLIDGGARTLALLGQAVPGFWLAIVLVLIFAVRLKWLPVSGSEGFRSLILPAITIGLFSTAIFIRLIRSSLLEVLSQDYIRTAYSKGLSTSRVVNTHALKNAAIPLVTALGLQISFLLGGALIVETIFAYPGMGRLAVNAIKTRDIPVIQAYVAVIAVITVGMTLFIDILYTWLDPRIRY